MSDNEGAVWVERHAHHQPSLYMKPFMSRPLSPALRRRSRCLRQSGIVSRSRSSGVAAFHLATATSSNGGSMHQRQRAAGILFASFQAFVRCDKLDDWSNVLQILAPGQVMTPEGRTLPPLPAGYGLLLPKGRVG